MPIFFSKAAGAAGGVSCEKIAHRLWSRPINRLVDHRTRIVELFSNLDYRWEAPLGHQNCCLLKSWQLCFEAFETDHRQLCHNYPIHGSSIESGAPWYLRTMFKRSNWENTLCMFQKADGSRYFDGYCFDMFLPISAIVNLNIKAFGLIAYI